MNSFVTFWIIALDNYYNIALHFFFFWVNLLMEFEDILWLFVSFLTEVSTTHIYIVISSAHESWFFCDYADCNCFFLLLKCIIFCQLMA